MNSSWQLKSVLGASLALAVISACTADPERKPNVPPRPTGGQAATPMGGAQGGEPSSSSGGKTPSGGSSTESSGGSRSSGGSKSSGGTDGSGGLTSVEVGVSLFDPDFSFSPLHFDWNGTVSAQVGSGWVDLAYEKAPLDLPAFASAYRFSATGNDNYLTTFTVVVPPSNLTKVGVFARDDLDVMFAQLAVFDSPNPEQAQLVVLVHDEFGVPLDEAVPVVPGAGSVAFLGLGVWDDSSEQTSQDGLFWAGNVLGTEFVSGHYAFSVGARGKTYPLTVPMAADALTFVDLEVQRQ